MKKKQRQQNDQKKSDLQGDTVFKSINQAQASFLYLPVKDPFEKRKPTAALKRTLYRVIKIK
ncbi:MAG: hypothetical protein IJ846_06070 [Alphaproteobacteria bacterium]|nr:hypothetical protein [Alphaproteobacteria bacterium]